MYSLSAGRRSTSDMCRRASSSSHAAGALLTWSGFGVKLVRVGVELVRVAAELFRLGLRSGFAQLLTETLILALTPTITRGCSPSEARLPPRALSSPG